MIRRSYGKKRAKTGRKIDFSPTSVHFIPIYFLQQSQHLQSSHVHSPPLQPSQHLQSSPQQQVFGLQQSPHLQSSQIQFPVLQPSQHLQTSPQPQVAGAASHASAWAAWKGQAEQLVALLVVALPPSTAPTFEQPVKATVNEKSAKTATPRMIL